MGIEFDERLYRSVRAHGDDEAAVPDALGLFGERFHLELGEEAGEQDVFVARRFAAETATRVELKVVGRLPGCVRHCVGASDERRKAEFVRAEAIGFQYFDENVLMKSRKSV